MATLVLDNFSQNMATLSLGENSEVGRFHDLGTGIARRINYRVTGDPFNLKGKILVSNGNFIQSAGYHTMHGLALQYGGSVVGRGARRHLSPLHINFSDYKELSIHFSGSTHNLSISVTVYSFSGHTGWSTHGILIGAGVDQEGNPYADVGTDKARKISAPLSAFAKNENTHASYNEKDIHVIHVGIQSLGFQGGHSYAIDKIELS